MRKKPIRFATRAEAEALQALQDSAAGGYPKPPTHIGAAFVAMGVTADTNTTLRDASGDPIGWVKHERDVAPVYDFSDPDNPVPTGEHELDLYAVSPPTEVELPDPTERAAETARVNARLARLTSQERATLAQALTSTAGGRPELEVP